MWKSACVGIHQLLKWKMHCETLKFMITTLSTTIIFKLNKFIAFWSLLEKKSNKNVVLTEEKVDEIESKPETDILDFQ